MKEKKKKRKIAEEKVEFLKKKNKKYNLLEI